MVEGAEKLTRPDGKVEEEVSAPTLEEADEVTTTTVVETKSATEDTGEQPAAISRVDEGTEATRGTAGQAGPMDGGLPL